MAKKYLVTDDELRAKVLAILRDVDTNPVGTIISFMGQQPPATYLRCDGGQHVIDEYQELADFIVVNFGAVNYFGGDGERYFAVPDLRGEFLRGAGVNGHENQGNGADVGKHQNGTCHLDLYTWNNDIGIVKSNKDVSSTNRDSSLNDSAQCLFTRQTSVDTNIEKTRGMFTSRPTNTSVLFCIKAKNG